MLLILLKVNQVNTAADGALCGVFLVFCWQIFYKFKLKLEIYMFSGQNGQYLIDGVEQNC